MVVGRYGWRHGHHRQQLGRTIGTIDSIWFRSAVQRRPLDGRTATLPNQFIHVLGRQLLAIASACCPGNRFVHQGASQVIHARGKQLRYTTSAHLCPGCLNVGDLPVKNDPCDRVHEHALAKSRPGPPGGRIWAPGRPMVGHQQARWCGGGRHVKNTAKI